MTEIEKTKVPDTKEAQKSKGEKKGKDKNEAAVSSAVEEGGVAFVEEVLTSMETTIAGTLKVKEEPFSWQMIVINFESQTPIVRGSEMERWNVPIISEEEEVCRHLQVALYKFLTGETDDGSKSQFFRLSVLSNFPEDKHRLS